MKATPIKNNSNSNTHSSKPFFSKSRQGIFFSRSSKDAPPFFTSNNNASLSQTKPKINSNDQFGSIHTRDNESEGESTDTNKLSANIQNYDGPVENNDNENGIESTGNLLQTQRTAEVTDQESTSAPLSITIGNVNSTTSPIGMPNRIPPRVDTDVVVSISGYSPPMADLVFSIAGANTTNGQATIDGAATKVQNNSATLKLRGTTQTTPGSSGNLQLVAKQNGTQLANSNSFSVSSIPQNFSVSFDSLINTGSRWGIRVNNDWESDSGNVLDLDEAKRSESVSYPTKTGVFSTVALSAHNSGYNPGHNPPRLDSHTLGPVTTLKNMKGNGTIIANQVFILWDKRTGAKDIPVNNSGFQITKALTYNAATSTTTLTTTKSGASVTANGNTSTAGSGNVTRPLTL